MASNTDYFSNTIPKTKKKINLVNEFDKIDF